MSSKKLCSIGILDIELNLILYNSEVEKYNFSIDKYKNVEDLKELFYPSESNYIKNKNIDNNQKPKQNIDFFEHISLSSKNNLINTLLFINRAYKSKTFIEFIMPNQLDFGDNTKFIHDLLIEICNKNYLFIIENKILDIASKIQFNILILNDETNETITSKNFELFEINDLEIEHTIHDENDNSNNENDFNEERKFLMGNMTTKIDYNFESLDYFLIDLLSFQCDLKWKTNKDMVTFLVTILNKNKNLKFILIINDKCFKDYKFTDLLESYKEIIELSDIIFASKDNINYFFQTYNSMYNQISSNFNFNNFYTLTKSINQGNKSNHYSKRIKISQIISEINKAKDFDFIIINNDKHRKNIPRLSIIFDNDFYSLNIYNQIGAQMDLNYNETFYFKIRPSNTHIIANEFYYSYIGGFLSRYFYNKSFRVCFYAGCLLLKKIYFYKKKRIYVTNIDDYNILVPNERQTYKQKMIQLNNKLIQENQNKEKGFILDCTNINNCKIKNYNPLMDNNCASYLLKKNNIQLLQKNGFINKKGIILKDPNFSLSPKKISIKNKKILKNSLNMEFNFNNMQKSIKYSNSNNNNDESSQKKRYWKTINNFYNHSNDSSKNINKKQSLPLLSRTTSNFKVSKGYSEKKGNYNNNSVKRNNNQYYKYLYQIYQPNNKFSEFMEKQGVHLNLINQKKLNKKSNSGAK